MSEIRSIARNTAIQIGGKIVSTLLGLLAVALLTRILGVEQFGWYATAVGFLQFCAIILDFGFILNTSKMLSEPAFDKTRLFNTLFTWRVIMALFFCGATAGIIWIFPYARIIKLATVIVALSFAANIVGHPFLGLFQARLKTVYNITAEIAARLVLLAGIYLLAAGHYGFLPMMWLTAGASWVMTIILIFKTEKLRLQIDWAITRAAFAKMWPSALSIFVNGIYLQGDRLLLPLYVSAKEVAFYGAAYRVLDIMAQIAFLAMAVMLPLLTFAHSRRLSEQFKKYYQLSFDLIMLVLFPMVVGTIILAGPLMRLVAGAQFAPAGAILSLLALSTFGVCLGMTFGQVALAIDAQRQTFWIFFADAVLSLIAYFIFIPRFGMYGAAGVTIFSEFFAGSALFIFCARRTGIALRLATAGKIIAAGGLMGTAVYLAQPLNIFLSILLGAVIYAALVMILKIISPQTLREVISTSPGAVVE